MNGVERLMERVLLIASLVDASNLYRKATGQLVDEMHKEWTINDKGVN